MITFTVKLVSTPVRRPKLFWKELATKSRIAEVEMFNPILSDKTIVKLSQAYDRLAYDLGEAAVLLKEAAVKTHALSGELYGSSKGALLLSVPNSLARGAFSALDENGLVLPNQGKFNAHIVVMTPEEVSKIGGLSKITERGKHFHYNLGALHEGPVTNSFDFSKVWFLSVASPELAQLRKTYGLDSGPGKHGFNIVVALRKLGVLGRNEISKLAGADTLPGGKADNVPDSRFDKNKLEHAQKHEMEHTNNPDIAKEVAKDHMLEDEDYYPKVEVMEKNKAADKLMSLLAKKSSVVTNAGHESDADVVTPAAEDIAFLGSKPAKPQQRPVENSKNKASIRKAVIKATENTLGVDPSLKSASWNVILQKLKELGKN